MHSDFMPLHSKKDPLVDEKGVDLQPNTLTQVAIQENQSKRLQAPYNSNCYKTWDESGYPEVFDYRPQMPYSMAVREFLL